jgi:hypothetical protein
MPLSPASVETLLRPALEPGQEWSEVIDRIQQGHAQLWLGENAAVVTEIVGDALHAWLGGGDLTELQEMRPLIEQAGREWGCKRATVSGRLGWDRAFKPHGYVRVLEKTL